jgi:hypothetical protein
VPKKTLRLDETNFKYFIFTSLGERQSCHPRWRGPERASMSKKGDELRQKAEELRANADNIRSDECHRISLELAITAADLADQWDAMELTRGYLGGRAE